MMDKINKKATIYDYARLCRKYHYTNCQSCPMCVERCNLRIMNDVQIDKANEIILKWCKEHPIKTRQSEFLEMFPNVALINCEVINICPKDIDIQYGANCNELLCEQCRKEYWLAEVDE